MADKNIGLLVAELNRAIQEGVKLFNYYKEKSKKFQEQQKILMNNTELKREFDNLKQKYKEEVKITSAQRNVTSLQAMRKLKKKYEKNLESIKKKSEKSELNLVNADKKFLKEKEKIRIIKKKVLENILNIGKKIKSLMDIEDFKKFIKRIQKRRYEVLNGKTISFKTLMHHLESGEISNEVSKKTKKIDKLMTIGNVVNRKKNMEIGIKKKEIEILLKGYDTTMKSLKELAAIKIKDKDEISNEDINSLLKQKYSKENSPEFKKKLNKLASDLRIINMKITNKMKKLKKLEKSS